MSRSYMETNKELFLGKAEICQLFISEQKMSQQSVFNPVFNVDSKMGSGIFVPDGS
jgi:hypothetical protein